MTLRRNSENFQAIRAKFEGSKQKPLSKEALTASKAAKLQMMGSDDAEGKMKLDCYSGSPMKNQSSSGRIQRLSSFASLSTMNVFSANRFQRRKNTDGNEASELSGDTEISSSHVAGSTTFHATRHSSNLNHPTISCASFGMSLGMAPKSAKSKAIPRFNTTGNLLLQPVPLPTLTLTPTPTASPKSTYKASSTANKRLSSSQSSNALPFLPRSRIPTPVRAREPSIATYTYSWTKNTPTKIETGTEQIHRHESALSGIGINVSETPSQLAKSRTTISLVPRSPNKSDVPLMVTKPRQVQGQTATYIKRAEASLISQAPLSRRWTAGPSQATDPEHEASASLRPSLPLKVQSSQNLSEQRPSRKTVPRAFSGGTTHFSSVGSMDSKHDDIARKLPKKDNDSNRHENLSLLEDSTMNPRSIYEISEAKPAPYWCGRLVAMQDRSRSEKYLSAINMPSATHHLSLASSSAENSQSDDGLENIFAKLQSHCITSNARESFVIFRKQYSRYRNPALARRRFHDASRYSGNSSSNITLDALSADLAGPSLLTRLKMKKGHM